MKPLRDYPPFIDAMHQLDNPFLGILLSAAFTALIQSSSATTAVIIVLAGQGLITIEQGIPLVLGASIQGPVSTGIGVDDTTLYKKVPCSQRGGMEMGT